MLPKRLLTTTLAFAFFLGCSSSDTEGNSQPATATCGDGVRQPSEACEGADFGGATCASVTLGSRSAGLLRCGPGCTFDDSGCVSATGSGGAFTGNGGSTPVGAAGSMIGAGGGIAPSSGGTASSGGASTAGAAGFQG